MASEKILIVEDAAGVSARIEEMLVASGRRATAVASGEEALAEVERDPPQLILMGVRLGGELDGIEVGRRIRERFDIPIIYVTALGDEALLRRVRTADAYGYLAKPIREGDLLATVEMALHRHGLETRLRESEERHRHLFETMTQGVVYQDADGRITASNPAAERILGLSLAQLQGRTSVDPRWRAIREDGSGFPGEAHPASESLRTGAPVRDVLMGVFNPEAGEYRWINVNAVPQFRPGEARPFQVFTTFDDITERRLREDEIKFRGAILDEMAEGVQLTRIADRVIVYANRQFERMFGYAPRELEGKPMTVLNAPTDRSPEETAAEVIAAVDRDGRWSGEVRNVRKDGTPFWSSVTVCPFTHPAHGRIWISIHRDITERKRAELELRAANRKFESLINSSPVGICTLNVDQKLTLWNRAMEKMFGWSAEEVLGHPLPYVPPEKRGEYEALVSRNLTGDVIPYVELRRQRKDGSLIDIGMSNAVYRDDEGNILGVLGMIQDITERKRAEEALRSSNELLALFLKHSPIYAFIKEVTPTESRMLFVSENYQDLLGIPGSKIAGMTMGELFPPDFAAKLTAEDWAVVIGGEVLRLDEELYGRKYTTVKYPIVQGDRTLLAGYSIDITDRKHAEHALRESEERFRTLFEASPTAIWVEDFSAVKRRFDELRSDGVRDFRAYFDRNPAEVASLAARVKVLAMNEKTAEVMGAETVEQVARDLPRLFTAESLGVFQEEMIALANGETQFRAEVPILNSQGSPIIVDLSLAVQPGCEESLSTVLASFLGITERRRAEESLREANELLNTVFFSSPIAIEVYDKDATLIAANPKVSEMFAVDAQALVGEFSLRKDPNYQDAATWERLARGEPVSAEIEFDATLAPYPTTKQGKSHLLVITTPVPDSVSSRVGYVTQILDVTDRKRAEEELSRSEERFSKAFHHAPALMALSRLEDGTYIDVNSRFCEVSGWSREEAVGRTSLELGWVAFGDRERVKATLLEKGSVEGMELTRYARDGRAVPCRYSGEVIEVGGEKQLLSLTEDLSERVELESRLRQAQKMEAIGTLAGGIAHDFNNILTPILAHADLAVRRVDAENPVRDHLLGIISAAERASSLVRQILAISRKEEGSTAAPVGLGSLVKETSKFLRASLPSTIEIRTLVDPACGPVLGDVSQLHQVVLNLCTNAGQAMAEKGGVLTVTLDRVDGAPIERPGAWNRLTVGDTGVGIPPEYLRRIFEPYFTTKPVGKGSGLGLAVVHGIVGRMGGEVRVQSRFGESTTFEVWLPEAAPVDEGAVSPTPEAPMGKGERVLVVDDEEAIREVLETMLVSLGYGVAEAPNGAEALAIFRADPVGFDAVFTDQTMPGMTGLSLARELRRIRPDLPIVLGTGFAEGVNAETSSEAGVRALIMKPYSRQKVAEALREVLGA